MKLTLSLLLVIFWSLVTIVVSAQSFSILVEAESFSDKGGWVIDQQSFDQIGSSYLMAHGVGKPVADATTKTYFPKKGKYHMWVRTRNWASAPIAEESAGRFQVAIDGETIPIVFGQHISEWNWHYGGRVNIKSVEAEIRLRDLTGFNGRCDAIIFSKDKNLIQHQSKDPHLALRNELSGYEDNPTDLGSFDLVVVGGGIAGMSASVAAARLGLKVALVHNRPVVGGNNSAEIRVHMASDLKLEPYPNLGNIVLEIDQKNPAAIHAEYLNYDSKNYNAKAEVLYQEPNITLLTEMHAYQANVQDDQIQSILARNISSNEVFIVRGKLFADCTGDGNLGFMAGADHRYGREPQSLTKEPMAIIEADSLVLGGSIQWVGEEADTTTTFPLTPWAHQFTPETCQNVTKGGWNWETGFQYDMVNEVEFIRDNMLRAIYGNWSFQKNHPDFKARYANYYIRWIGYILGKRESRRLLGDIIYSQNELIEDPHYEDATVPCRWGIDLHYPDPENSKHFPNEEFRSVATHSMKDMHPTRTLPYRSFYSRNINNLFMAGRCASMTHLAHGMFRNQHTTGMMGEVVGMAAYVCIKQNTLPRGVYETHWNDMVQLLTSGL